MKGRVEGEVVADYLIKPTPMRAFVMFRFYAPEIHTSEPDGFQRIDLFKDAIKPKLEANFEDREVELSGEFESYCFDDGWVIFTRMGGSIVSFPRDVVFGVRTEMVVTEDEEEKK